MTVSFYLYKHLQGMGIQYTCILVYRWFVLSKSYNLNWGVFECRDGIVPYVTDVHMTIIVNSKSNWCLEVFVVLKRGNMVPISLKCFDSLAVKINP